jgi:hypothetical protein
MHTEKEPCRQTARTPATAGRLGLPEIAGTPAITETQGTEGTPTTAREIRNAIDSRNSRDTSNNTDHINSRDTAATVWTTARTVTTKAETLGTTGMPATAGGHQHQVCQRQKRRQPMTPAPAKLHSICMVETMSNVCLLENSLHYYILVLFKWALYINIVMLSL